MGFRAKYRQVTVQTNKAKWEQDVITEKEKRKSSSAKGSSSKSGSSSNAANRPELAAFFLALRDTLIEEPLLFLCVIQSLLKAVNRWIDEGVKQRWWGHLTRMFWQQPSRYYERGLQQRQQPFWSK